jgi:hypothetical protein
MPGEPGCGLRSNLRNHSGGKVDAHIRSLICRENQGLCSVNPAARDLLSIHEQRTVPAFAWSASVIGKLETDIVFALGKRFSCSNGKNFDS